MTFALRPAGTLADDIRRIACAQLDSARAGLADGQEPDAAIHEARKCLKRTRSLLRLARPGLEARAYKKTNTRLRDIGRLLSGARDAQAMIDTLGALQERHGADWNTALIDGLRAAFQARQQRLESQVGSNVEEATQRLERASKRLSRLALNERKLSLGDGIERTYAKARAQFRAARQAGNAVAYHEWRKHAQGHWRQMQLLTAAWPDEIKVRAARARALSRCLGDDHDLHVLLGHVAGVGPDIADWNELEDFYDHCIARQQVLRLEAHGHGRLLFAERPGAFRTRMMRYWAVARERFSHGARVDAAYGVALIPAASQERQVVPLHATPEGEHT